MVVFPVDDNLRACASCLALLSTVKDELYQQADVLVASLDLSPVATDLRQYVI
jgi:hypothetical protein